MIAGYTRPTVKSVNISDKYHCFKIKLTSIKIISEKIIVSKKIHDTFINYVDCTNGGSDISRELRNGNIKKN